MSSASTSLYNVTAMLWGKTSRPAPRVSTLVPFIDNESVAIVRLWLQSTPTIGVNSLGVSGPRIVVRQPVPFSHKEARFARQLVLPLLVLI